MCVCVLNRSLVSDSLRPHGLHTRPPCPSPTPGVYPNMSIELVMPSNHLILCRPLLLLPSIFPSIRVFSNESILHIRWPKYWSFSISPSNEYSGLIFFRMDWLAVLASKALVGPTGCSGARLALQNYPKWRYGELSLCIITSASYWPRLFPHETWYYQESSW